MPAAVFTGSQRPARRGRVWRRAGRWCARGSVNLECIVRNDFGPSRVLLRRLSIEIQPQTWPAAAATFFGAEMDAVAAAVRGGHGRHAARGQRAPRGSRGVHVLRLRPRLCRVCPRPSCRKGRRRASRPSTRFRPHLWRGYARCEPLWALALPCAVPGPRVDAGCARGAQKCSFPGRWALFYSARRAVRDERGD